MATQAEKYIEYDHRDAVTCWPKGFYRAQLSDVNVVPHKSGGHMMELVWRVGRGKERQIVSDYIVPGTQTIRKLKDLARATSDAAVEAFKRDAFQPADHLMGMYVVFLGVEESEEYGDKNRISAVKSKDWQPTEKDRKAGYAMPDFKTQLTPDDFKGDDNQGDGNGYAGQLPPEGLGDEPPF